MKFSKGSPRQGESPLESQENEMEKRRAQVIWSLESLGNPMPVDRQLKCSWSLEDGNFMHW